MNPENRTGLFGWLAFLSLAVLVVLGGIWLVGQIAPEQSEDNNLSPDEVFHILWDKGYAINGKTDLKGRVGEVEFIDEAIGFSIEGHSCLVISYNSLERAEEAAS